MQIYLTLLILICISAMLSDRVVGCAARGPLTWFLEQGYILESGSVAAHNNFQKQYIL